MDRSYLVALKGTVLLLEARISVLFPSLKNVKVILGPGYKIDIRGLNLDQLDLLNEDLKSDKYNPLYFLDQDSNEHIRGI